MKVPVYTFHKGEPKCLSRGFESLRKQKVTKMRIKTYEYEKERDFALVHVHEYDPVEREYNDEGILWADVVTGTLYKPTTGECLSSTKIQLLVD